MKMETKPSCVGEMDHSKEFNKDKVKAVTARRRRSEIMRFRSMANSTFVADPPPKRVRLEDRGGEVVISDISIFTKSDSSLTFTVHNQIPTMDKFPPLEGEGKSNQNLKKFIEDLHCNSEDMLNRNFDGETPGLKGSEDRSTSLMLLRNRFCETQMDEHDTKHTKSEQMNMTEPLSGFSADPQREISSKEASSCIYNSRYRSGCVPADDCPPHGIISVCGRRREMEDAVSVIPSFVSLPSWAIGACNCNTVEGCGKPSSCHFFGIYDGHGGDEAALHCKKHLHKALIDEIKSVVDASTEETKTTVSWESQWQKAFAACFLKMDTEISATNKEDMVPETVGSTATVVVLGPSQIIVANCGDSRVVLSRSGQVIPLSSDHKPQRPDELARVEAAGGWVLYRNGYRVDGILAMSRAIGDRYLKPYVIADPEITYTQRTEADECLIIASDGLWDILSNELVCDVARKCLSGWKSRNSSNSASSDQDNLTESPAKTAAAFLTKLALAKGSSDNISVVVVDLTSKRRVEMAV